MASELLRMMSNDPRLSPLEISLTLKHLLAKRLRREKHPPAFPVLRDMRRITRPAPLERRSYSPDLVSATLSPGISEPRTPSLTSSTGYLSLLSNKSTTRDRSNTHSDPHKSPHSRTICNPHPDSPYEYETLQTAFTQLYSRLNGFDGTRISPDGSPEVHINNVKQFLLECYVNSQTLLTTLLSPFKAAKWADVRGFVAGIEAVQLISYDHSFFNKDELMTTKNNLIRQKLLCKCYAVFFKLVDYNQKNSLSRFEVKTVSSLALRTKKKVNSENLDLVVHKAFDKAKEQRGFASDLLTFEEFYSVLKN